VAEVLLFHHALGLTDGVRAFAGRLRAAGHTVHAPDLYAGRTLGAVEEGVAHARQAGFEEIRARSLRLAEGLPQELVYAGMSLGVMAAQELAQTRPGARGALLLHAAVPPGHFGDAWPDGVPLQLHTMEDDGWGDVAEARELAAAVPGAELHFYPGDRHLFTDESLPDHFDAAAAALVEERALRFLAGLG
jgi:dienelactone hydrolase